MKLDKLFEKFLSLLKETSELGILIVKTRRSHSDRKISPNGSIPEILASFIILTKGVIY